MWQMTMNSHTQRGRFLLDNLCLFPTQTSTYSFVWLGTSVPFRKILISIMDLFVTRIPSLDRVSSDDKTFPYKTNLNGIDEIVTGVAKLKGAAFMWNLIHEVTPISKMALSFVRSYNLFSFMYVECVCLPRKWHS